MVTKPGAAFFVFLMAMNSNVRLPDRTNADGMVTNS
jgi:hypothetical protein